MNDSYSLTPVSYVIFRRGDSVLLQLRRDSGYMDGHWSTAAAGHVEAGESAGQAALRETREELGVVIAASDLVALTAMHRAQAGGSSLVGRVDFFFTCTAWAGTPRILESDKAAGLRWFQLHDLPAKVVPHERYVLERLKTGLPPVVTFGFPLDGDVDG